VEALAIALQRSGFAVAPNSIRFGGGALRSLTAKEEAEQSGKAAAYTCAEATCLKVGLVSPPQTVLRMCSRAWARWVCSQPDRQAHLHIDMPHCCLLHNRFSAATCCTMLNAVVVVPHGSCLTTACLNTMALGQSSQDGLIIGASACLRGMTIRHVGMLCRHGMLQHRDGGKLSNRQMPSHCRLWALVLSGSGLQASNKSPTDYTPEVCAAPCLLPPPPSALRLTVLMRTHASHPTFRKNSQREQLWAPLYLAASRSRQCQCRRRSRAATCPEHEGYGT